MRHVRAPLVLALLIAVVGGLVALGVPGSWVAETWFGPWLDD